MKQKRKEKNPENITKNDQSYQEIPANTEHVFPNLLTET